MRYEVTLTFKTWRLGLLGQKSFSRTRIGGAPQPTRWPLLMRAAAKPGLEVEPVDEAGKAGARASATRMVLTNNISNRGPHKSRIILGDGSIKMVHFVGKLDLVFHSRTDHPVTLHDVSFVPDVGFDLFSST